MPNDTRKAVEYASRGKVTNFEDEVKSVLDTKTAEKLEAIRREIAQDLLHIESLAPRPNAGGEKKFVDLHKVQKHKHPVAGDDQFTCDKPKAKRRADVEAGDADGIKDEADSTVSTLRKTSVAVGPIG